MRVTSRDVDGSRTAAWTGSGLVGWGVVLTVLLTVILVPFALWEGALLDGTERLLSGGLGSAALSLALAGLLASDVLLPVPSSLVSTAAGNQLGFVVGTVVSTTGLSAGCLLAYWLGARLGKPAVDKLAGATASGRAELVSARYGDWGLVVCRAVPVLAEASVLLAGLGRFRLRSFLVLTALANLGVSVVYAWIGARAASSGSLLFAFAGAVAVPGLAMALWRLAVVPPPRSETTTHIRAGGPLA